MDLYPGCGDLRCVQAAELAAAGGRPVAAGVLAAACRGLPRTATQNCKQDCNTRLCWLQCSLCQGVPANIEQLEEVIQDHREFLLDLDSHKSVAMSINVVGSHLAEHSPTQSKAEGMRGRLATVNLQWDRVCEQATLWQTRLQTALLEVTKEFIIMTLLNTQYIFCLER